ncbi:arsenite efflux ATP-binding protein ArsA (TC 3.A.4.1.1) [Stackebrandtia albiflava]|uniref:Arsenite efflux ATP-binding protein ArsA (TC 3.A.4.1.1) n=1 Tax=Stackebrandtia albiflava TaxID=406432 RepID=A0A562UYA7_9ACTN|nr:ArsA-related P-loop ATPase [Stackebrandtia albiflava]TWJ10595.1 arsenite efflux ATP-binding protein ArsA (TC 3.A.4.1.1) [Stackebrandtia albiflava]
MPSDAAAGPVPHLHVVTGKGGVGKTTVAAALAMALTPPGGRTLLVEVEGRQALASLFDTPALPYAERHVATAPGGGEVFALAVDAEAALLDYLAMFYKLGSAGKALRKVGAIDFATTIAPGLRDILLTGKVKEAATRTDHGRRVYDAVVLDAPPTGRVSRFLNVTVEASKLAKVGPIRTHSDGVAKLLHSPATAVHVVTRLEEMPVQETADALAELAALKLPVGDVIVNSVNPPLLAGVRVTKAGLKRDLAAVGLPSDQRTVAALAAEAADHQQRLAVEDRLRGELSELGRPMVELPLFTDGMDLSNLYEMAALLREHLDGEAR